MGPMFIREPVAYELYVTSSDPSTEIIPAVDEATLIEKITFQANVANTAAGTIRLKMIAPGGLTGKYLPFIDWPASGALIYGSLTERFLDDAGNPEPLCLPVGWALNVEHDIEVAAPGDTQLNILAHGGILR